MNVQVKLCMNREGSIQLHWRANNNGCWNARLNGEGYSLAALKKSHGGMLRRANGIAFGVDTENLRDELGSHSIRVEGRAERTSKEGPDGGDKMRVQRQKVLERVKVSPVPMFSTALHVNSPSPSPLPHIWLSQRRWFGRLAQITTPLLVVENTIHYLPPL